MIYNFKSGLVEKVSKMYIEIVSDIIYSMSYKELEEIPIIEYDESSYNFIKDNCIKFTGGDGNAIYSMGTFLFKITNKNAPDVFINSSIFLPK